MDSTFTRTSVTVDEAVAILLGSANGPIGYQLQNEYTKEGVRFVTDEERDGLESQWFSLPEELVEQKEQLESDLKEAEIDKRPPDEIESIQEKIREHAKEMDMAKTYLCAIHDELNKGATSALRKDVELTNGLLTYITMASLNAWAANSGYRDGILAPVAIDAASRAVQISDDKKNPPRSRQRQRDQENAILAEIERLGYNPLELPKNKPGKPGVKAKAWESLMNNDLFGKRGVFDKAWERLGNDKTIAYKNGDPPPPKNIEGNTCGGG